MAKPRICVISEDLYLLYENVLPRVGGIEVQQYLLIPFLKERFEISIIVGDFGQENVEEIDGIKFFKLSRNKRYPNFLRGIIRLAEFWRSLSKTDADIYYFELWAAEAKFLTPLSVFCKLRKRKFVLGISHDFQVEKRKRPSKKNGFYYGLKKPDMIIAHTQTQQKLLKQNYNKESVVINYGIKIHAYNLDDEKSSFIL